MHLGSLEFKVLESHGLGDTYPALSAAGARSHKYFWLAAGVEAEPVTELLGGKEHALKHSGRIGQNTGYGDSQDQQSPAIVPTLTSCHRRYISNSAKGQGIQWAEAGRQMGHEDTKAMSSRPCSDLYHGYSLGPEHQKRKWLPLRNCPRV